MTAHGPAYNAVRVRPCNDRPIDPSGNYVLYWSQIYRRLSHNHALDYALARSKELGKPVVFYEGLKLGYRWASVRTHKILLEGMRENARAAKEIGLNYWPFVATPERDSKVLANPEAEYAGFEPDGRGLLRRLAADACLVVTDDWRCFVVPEQTAALAAKADAAVHAVDSNGVVPMALLGPPVSAANHLRSRVHKNFAEAWRNRSAARPDFHRHALEPVEPGFPLWNPESDLDGLLARLPIDQSVPAAPEVPGGSAAARRTVDRFIAERLPKYSAGRNAPGDPEAGAASRLSPYFRNGHVSAEEVVERVLSAAGEWDVTRLVDQFRGKRDGYFGGDENVNGFIDEAVIWRDVGQHWHWHRHRDTASLDKALPEWALKTLKAHAGDERNPSYTPEQLEAGETSDELWNAAQRELVATGTIHNYMRMLWGKKVLEWSPTVDQAYQVLEDLNNKYAADGRDPNSYSGILWCFGLFDRPWPPERKVFGVVRYMSSDSTRKKFKMAGYLDYVNSLPPVADVRAGKNPRRRKGLFDG